MGRWALGVSVLAAALAACEAVPDLRYAAVDGSSPPDDAPPSVDAGDDAPVNPADAQPDADLLPCGDAGACDFATSTCCLTRLGFECTIRGTSCTGTDLECQDTSDCMGNKVCCGTASDAGLKKFACMAPNACAMNGSPACDLAFPCDAGTACAPTSVDGYGLCQ
jgi:hypothetical protein